MKSLYLLDRLISKHVEVKNVASDLSLMPGQKVVYINKEDGKKYVGINVWYPVECEKEGQFDCLLSGRFQQQFDLYQQKAQDRYKIFKKQFSAEFAGAIPITARADLFGKIIYFYFYSEDRYNFSEFVKQFRQQIQMQFFIYQVGARDMIRLSPAAPQYLYACGCGPTGCCSLGKLPSVEMDNLSLQGLEGRDVEKLKWRCGKLKCSIVYERSLYLEETKKFPKKGERVEVREGVSWICIGHNIMTSDVTVKTDTGEIIKTPVAASHLPA